MAEPITRDDLEAILARRDARMAAEARMRSKAALPLALNTGGVGREVTMSRYYLLEDLAAILEAGAKP